SGTSPSSRALARSSPTAAVDCNASKRPPKRSRRNVDFVAWSARTADYSRAMLTHVVCFKFDDLQTAEDVKARLQAMAERIPSLRAIEAGVDVLRSPRSYDVALITRFDDLAGLEAYQVHPVHQEVVEFIKPRSRGAVSVDFES